MKQCRDLLAHSLSQEDGELLDAQQSARLIAAEKYYRVMYYGGV